MTAFQIQQAKEVREQYEIDNPVIGRKRVNDGDLSGLEGIILCRHLRNGKFRVTLNQGGNRSYLKTVATVEEAREAWKEALKKVVYA